MHTLSTKPIALYSTHSKLTVDNYGPLRVGLNRFISAPGCHAGLTLSSTEFVKLFFYFLYSLMWPDEWVFAMFRGTMENFKCFQFHSTFSGVVRSAIIDFFKFINQYFNQNCKNQVGNRRQTWTFKRTVKTPYRTPPPPDTDYTFHKTSLGRIVINPPPQS